MAEEKIETNEVDTKEEGIDYSDDEILTPENKSILKKLAQTEGWEIVKKMINELTDTAEEEIIKQAKAYSAVKSHGYTIFDIQWAWIDGLNKIVEILDAISREDEVRKAVEEVNEAEAQQIK